jgi:integrase
MAYLRKVKGGWRAEVEKLGVRRSKTFVTKAEAAGWAAAEETAIRDDKTARWPRKTLTDAIKRYRESVSSHKRGERAEGLRFDALEREFPWLVSKQLVEITSDDWARWRDARLKVVTPGAVRRDVNLFRNLFAVARDEWKWIPESPFKGFRVPADNASRDRRVAPAEVKALCRWLGYRTGQVEGKQQQVALAFLLALRTAMRASELLSLSDTTVDLERRVARVPHKTQHITGKLREVPLSRAAVRLLKARSGRGKFFDLTDKGLDALFRKARDALMIQGLHFHDSRAEALTRLAKRVDVLTLARISGHKDLRMLNEVYYRESSADIAARI